MGEKKRRGQILGGFFSLTPGTEKRGAQDTAGMNSEVGLKGAEENASLI